VISYRGSAYCKEPTAEYEKPLLSIIAACNQASRAPDTAGALVDCKDPRYTSAAPVDQLLRWVEIGLRGLDSMPESEKAQLEPTCARALSYAGAAHCKAPTDPRAGAAIARVNKECAAARARFATKAADAATAQAASVNAAKADRKVVAFPRPTFRGGGAGGLAAQMKRALLAGGVAKAATELLRVQPMGRWQSGRSVDTKVPYQKIMGTVLWWDNHRDGVCRFSSYKFVKEGAGRGRWSALKFKGFCNGCPEGWTRCK